MAFSMSLGNLYVKILGDNSKLAQSLRGAEAMIDKTSQKMKAVGKTLSKNVTLPLAAVGAASLKAFSNFDGAMTQSLAIMNGVTPKIRKEMEATAKTLASEGIQSATELAESYFFLASAGLSAEQSIAALPTVQNFATAGMFDMSQATDLLTDAQSALGLTVDDTVKNMENMTRLSDVLVKANTLANASVEQFSTALTAKAATAMRSYGIELEEGVAVLAAYADQGIKAELAGNQFARMLRLLIKGVNDNGEAFERLGIATTDSMGNLMPIADIMEGIHQATKNMGSTTKAATLEMLGFEARAQDAILPLLGMSDALRGYETQLRKAGGTTKNVSDKQLTAFGNQMRILWNNVKLAGIEIGKVLAPAVSALAKNLKSALQWFQKLNQSTKNWIVALAALAAVLGPLLIALSSFGLILKGLLITIALLTPAIGFLIAAVKALWVAFAPALPIIALVAAIGVAVWALLDAVTNTDMGIIKWMKNFEIGGRSMLTWMKAMSETFWRGWQKAITFVKKLWEGWKLIGKNAFEFIKRTALRVADKIQEGWFKLVLAVADVLDEIARGAAIAQHAAGFIDDKELDKAIRKIDDERRALERFANDTDKFYNEQIRNSLAKSQENQNSYWAEIDRIRKEDLQKAQEYKAEMDKIFATPPGTANFMTGGEVTTGPGILARPEEFDFSKSLFSEYYSGILQQQQDFNQNYVEVERAHSAEVLSEIERRVQEHLALERAKQNALVSGTGSLFGMLAQVAALGGKKTFDIYKAFALAEAGIAAYTAYNQALKNPPGPPYTYPAAAAALGMGLLRVRQIAMMKPGSSAGGGGGGGTTGGVDTTTPTGITENLSLEEAGPEAGRNANITVVIENVHGSADPEFARQLADEINDLVGDGVDYGFVTIED